MCCVVPVFCVLMCVYLQQKKLEEEPSEAAEKVQVDDEQAKALEKAREEIQNGSDCELILKVLQMK